MKDVWDPQKYEEFKNERSLPFFELLELVRPGPADSCVDLGCGTGELTKILHSKIKPERIIGVDNSRSMLSKAWDVHTPGLSFELKDISEALIPNNWNLVFSNAALQWCDNHAELFRKIFLSLNS